MACSGDKPNIKIDSFVFRLHYKLTAPVFICSSLFVLIWQLINPIECLGGGVEREFVENYCWSHGTYVIEDSGNRIPISHYPWVPLTFFIQGLVFLLTIFYWKSIENGRIRWLINDLWKRDVPEQEKEQQLHLVVNYFIQNFHKHSCILHFSNCEDFNLYIAGVQFYLMGWLIGYKFLLLMPLPKQPVNDWMAIAFPKVTFCDFNITSFDGSIQEEQTECQLNMNYLNEKIYSVLWFWVGLLTLISGLELILLVWHACFGSKICAFMTRRLPQRPQPGSHIYKMRSFWRVRILCDWTDVVFLNLIRQNMDSEIFKEFIEALEVKLLFTNRLENIRISINNIIANNAA